MMIWFTADTHFGHTRILDYVPRKFASIEDHDEYLIESWNSCVSHDDEVIFAGDFSFLPKKQTRSLFHKLNGRIKRLVVGNHDHSDTRNLPWDSVEMIREVVIEGKPVVICHYPMVQWNKSHYGSVHLHGHVHGTMFSYGNNRIDIGVDVWNYRPVSWDALSHGIRSSNSFDPRIHRGAMNFDVPIPTPQI